MNTFIEKEKAFLDEIASLHRQLQEKDNLLALMRQLINETKDALKVISQDSNLAREIVEGTAHEKVGTSSRDDGVKDVSDKE